MKGAKKIGAVILTRYNSRRLPGKALMEINGKPILSYIIERLEQVLPKDGIILATSTEKTDNAIADYAEKKGVSCFRGNLENVARRFYEAGADQGWDYAIRINGDNVFADTKVLNAMIEKAKSGNIDFVSNVKDRTYPKGMSIEIVRLDWYQNLLPFIEDNTAYREHVTLYIYENNPPGTYFFKMNLELPEAAGIQLALDTPDDLERTRQIISTFDHPHYTYNLEEIIELYGEQ